MENEIPIWLSKILSFGCYIGISYVLTFPIYVMDLIMQIVLEKREKRKTLIGKLDTRECRLIEEQYNKCRKDFKNENLKELGELTLCFLEGHRINQEQKKKTFDKLKFWKRKDK